MAGHFPDDPDKILEDTICTRVATLLTTGIGPTAVAKELGLSVSRIKTISKSDKCISVMRQIANHEKDAAKARVAHQASNLIDECFRVIRDRLRKNDLKAVSINLKAVGAFEMEPTAENNDTQLVVVMPGATAPDSPINVTPTIKENEND